jgi:protein LSM14
VALENVSSFGTEGRKNNPDEEISPSDSVYEYIVFRGSDVKDLRIEEAPAAKENKPPQVPNDPAILGVSALSPLVDDLAWLWDGLCICFYVMKYFGC